MAAKKILIVEDDSMLREALVEQFSENGFIVHGSPDGKDAYEYLKEETPNAVITDLVMSGINGFDILRTIKESMHLKDVPVVIISNSSSQENVEKAVSLGATDFLVKAELSLSQIVNKIKEIV